MKLYSLIQREHYSVYILTAYYTNPHYYVTPYATEKLSPSGAPTEPREGKFSRLHDYISISRLKVTFYTQSCKWLDFSLRATRRSISGECIRTIRKKMLKLKRYQLISNLPGVQQI